MYKHRTLVKTINLKSKNKAVYNGTFSSMTSSLVHWLHLFCVCLNLRLYSNFKFLTLHKKIMSFIFCKSITTYSWHKIKWIPQIKTVARASKGVRDIKNGSLIQESGGKFIVELLTTFSTRWHVPKHIVSLVEQKEF